MVPSIDMGFWREDCESRVLVLGSDLVISELLDKFRAGYHFQGLRSTLPSLSSGNFEENEKNGNWHRVNLCKLAYPRANHAQNPFTSKKKKKIVISDL